MYSALNRLFTKIHLRYEDLEEEQEYIETKTPAISSFLKYLLLALTAILLVFCTRYFVRDVFPQNWIVVGFIIFGIIIFLIRKRVERYIEFVLFVYLLAIIGMLMSVYSGSQTTPEKRISFYVGYTFAMVHRLVGYRVLTFKYMVLLYIFSISLKFPLIHNPDPFSNVINISLDVLTVALAFGGEINDRGLFHNLYKSKKHILKFKHLLTQYLPNQIAIFPNDYSSASYMNNAFRRTFRCQNITNVKEALAKFHIERDTIDKNKPIFQHLGCKMDEESTENLNLSQFMDFLSQNVDMLRDLGVISFPVVEDDKLDITGLADLKAVKDKVSLDNKDNSSIPKAQNNTSKKKTKLLLHEKTPTGVLRLPEINESNNKGSSDKGSSRTSSSDPGYEEGTKRMFKVKIFPLLWDDTEAIAMVMDDITQQKIIMELKVADKNKDMVIAMVSHELRTPLNGMLGLLDIAIKNVQEKDASSYLGACKNSGLLMLNLVNSILDLHQIKNKKLRLVNSKTSIPDLFTEIKSLFDYFCTIKQVYLNIEVMANVPRTIVTDRNRLSQILINLLGNAFKFTFSGGVTLRVEQESLDPLKLKFSVQDTGIGIKKEDQERLFKMFGRIDHQDKNINTQGIGLGLTISNTLAVLLNPSDNKGIQVQSEPGVGTCFSFAVQSHDETSLSKLEDVSLADISSIALYEDREATIMRKMGVYTINNNENFTRLSSNGIDSRLGSSPPLEKRLLYSDSLKAGDSLALTTEECLPLKSSSRGLLKKDSEIYKNKETTSLQKMAVFKEVQEEEESGQEVEQLEFEQRGNGKPWCLVVDDNPFNLMVACHIMEERGYNVKTALNGQEAIQKVHSHNQENHLFKVILMDCQMPVMDGYQATRVLKKSMKNGEIVDCPIIALTANNRDDEHEKLCTEVGMSGHIAKPLQISELESVLKQVSKDAKTKK